MIRLVQVSRVLLPKVHRPPDTVKEDIDMAFLSVDDAELRHVPKKMGEGNDRCRYPCPLTFFGNTKFKVQGAAVNWRW